MVMNIRGAETNSDYEYVSIGKSGIKIHHLLFALGIIMLLALVIYGNISDDVNTQAVLIWVSLFAIGASIMWTIRKKLVAVIIAFIALITLYFVSGYVLTALGSDIAYSYGVVTFIIMAVFIFWICKDNEVGWDDMGKIILFIAIAYIINATGWLGGVNEITASYFTGGLPI